MEGSRRSREGKMKGHFLYLSNLVDEDIIGRVPV